MSQDQAGVWEDAACADYHEPLCAKCHHPESYHINGVQDKAIPCDYEMNLAPEHSHYCGCITFIEPSPEDTDQ